MAGIRNSAKAMIIHEGKLLCAKHKNENEIFYVLIGGGQEYGENLVEALKRECREEANAQIEVGDLRFVRDYIGKNHEHAEYHPDYQGVELMFRCTLKPGTEASNGATPDTRQIGIEWLEIEKLNEYNLYPKVLKELIKIDEMKGPVYLGDVN